MAAGSRDESAWQGVVCLRRVGKHCEVEDSWTTGVSEFVSECTRVSVIGRWRKGWRVRVRRREMSGSTGSPKPVILGARNSDAGRKQLSSSASTPSSSSAGPLRIETRFEDRHPELQA